MIVGVRINASIFTIFFILTASALQQEQDYPPCIANRGEQDECATFAVFRTNSYYSSLSNFSSYLGIIPSEISKANNFPAGADLLAGNQLLLIPIHCRCGGGGFFEADLTKTTAKGESFSGIAQSLEGLASYKGIQDKNPSFAPWNAVLGEKQVLQIPVKCSCPSALELSQKIEILISYPVNQGDTVANLAVRFNTTPEKLVSVNGNRSSEFKPENLLPFTTLLIPATAKPGFLPFPTAISKPGKKKAAKMRKKRVYIAIGAIVFVVAFFTGAAFLFLQWRKKNQHHLQGPLNRKLGADSELQQLGLSVRTTSEKKVSFEGSNEDSLHRQQSSETVSTTISATAKKKTTLVEIYSSEELKKATEYFSSTNLIEDSVFHGRLNGKEIAIKKTSFDKVSKIEFVLFQDAIHRHPNILRLLGTTFSGAMDQDQSPDSYLVFEYAKNGTLKDWLHGGLAMKSQFISSCNCFLNWSERLRICRDVASALHFMHQVMNPPYCHKNIKSRNVFLDEDFNAKIGNFGMAECGEKEDEKKNAEDDVFAFGVILLEVLSGGGGGEEVCLSREIKRILKSEDADEALREWMDKALGEKYWLAAAATVAELAGACVEDDPGLRPNAGEIVDKLTRLVEEDAAAEGEERGFAAVCESSSKPLVQAPAVSCSETGGGNG